ncbi:PQQ-binding-like beta-propeller repeat protein [Shewanella eurypsychrophilus]|uniref:PQQ-binding-like beta-propeller repeat protein n=1 Tax=Shewanella eurypsychrophilus TaxID=2593656 RepID=A0ABX6V1G4_9GAMM|nr:MULTISPECIES: PQQ-binding-like beta-propeller repeat protein [Shewanella]QFU21177.1 PQQ-binding-like beta-propeller repeat protein [Shewanella sp. YLB-09]QPG56468.1 PQQ-binding-like beta-propeller repeat protein [Shewanella eurypsychrophilus]
MKLTITLTLLMLCLFGCGGGDDNSSPEPQPTPVTDTDNDGIADNVDKDDDGDGVDDDKDAFPLDATESVDTDGDGIGNNADTDDDGDAVLDEDDAFPLDAAESVDTDGDGIGNNADTDDDGDAVLDENDAFPLDATESVDTDGDGVGDNSDFFLTDASCFAESDGSEGFCYLTWMASQTVSVVEYGDNGVVYFSGPQWGLVHRYDSNTEHFLTPVVVQASDTPTMAYSAGHQRFYISDDNGDISYIDEDELAHFVTLDNPATSLIPVGNYLLTLVEAYYSSEYATYNITGVVSEQNNNHFAFHSSAYSWNQAKSRLYHFQDGLSPNDLLYTEIDQLTGQIGQSVDSPYHGDYSIEPPLSISLDGSTVLLGSGDLYDAETLEWTGSIASQFSSAFWLADNALVTLQANSGESFLVRRNKQLALQEYVAIDGELLGAFSNSDSAVLVLKTAERVLVSTYLVNDDNDGDGVVNIEDAFAHNAAFSKDTDNDGFADELNEGIEANAEILALIDAYPQDSACWLAEHGVDGVCDYHAMVPNFSPDDVITIDGVVYLLSADNKKIYRWISDTQSYTNPINLRSSLPFNSEDSATQLAYSETHERLYVGFDFGAIKYVELDNLALLQEFANLSKSVDGLASVGNFILAQDSTGAWVSHHIYNQDGMLTDSKDWNYFSHTYAWNEDTSKVYFLRDGTSPNDLHFEEIDQTNGTIISAGDSPYHSSAGIAHPIRISSDNSKIILGSGRVFDATTLDKLADLALSAIDIRWIGDEIFALSVNEAGSSVISIWSADDYQKIGELNVSGAPVSLEINGDDLVVVTMTGDTLSYLNQLVADHDGDGLPGWWEDLYGLDDANSNDAAVDSDADGLINIGEFEARTNPNIIDTDGDGLSDGDEVNTVHSEPLNADSDGDGISDGDEVNEHGTDPLNSDSDGDGLSDYLEVATLGTNPLSLDSDSDGMPDAWEVDNATNPLVNDTSLDNDSDGLINADEFAYGSDPSVIDSDFDSLSDGDEVHTYNTDPTNADTDEDRMPDGWELTFGFNPNLDSDSALDFDTDGFSNVKEYFLKTDPTNLTDKPVAKQWSSNQGNAAHNGLNVVDINSNDLSLRWSVDIPVNFDYTNDSIVIADSKVVVTGNQINNSSVKEILSLDALDGTIVWQKSYEVNSITPPAVSDGKVYFQTGGHDDSFVRALDITSGNLVFKSAYSNQWSDFAAPTPFGDSIYVGGGSYGGIYRFDASSGEEIWFRGGSHSDYWTPAVDQQSVYFFNEALDILDRETGELSASIAVDGLSFNGQIPILGNEDDLFVNYDNELVAFDLAGNTVKWQKQVSYSTSISVGFGEVYIINNDSINALDSRDGALLWAWEPDNNESLQGNIVVSNNLLFVSGSSTTFAVNLESHQQVWSISESGKLSLGNEGALYILNQQDSKLVAINVSGDADNDGMLDWYEDYYGFDKLNADDAILDADNDGLTNVEEYDLSTNPVSNDTDGDQVNDGEEVNTYLTNPLLMDTDYDGLDDGTELNSTLTDPLLGDTDGDSFSDGDEVNLYASDPNDADSRPTALTEFNEGFEAELVLNWQSGASSGAPWANSQTNSSQGETSFRSGSIGDSQVSSTEFKVLVASGVLSFDSLVLSEPCCDLLKVYVNDELMMQTASQEWSTHSLSLEAGENTVRFDYTKDGSASSLEDAVWIDNLVFNQ